MTTYNTLDKQQLQLLLVQQNVLIQNLLTELENIYKATNQEELRVKIDEITKRRTKEYETIISAKDISKLIDIEQKAIDKRAMISSKNELNSLAKLQNMATFKQSIPIEQDDEKSMEELDKELEIELLIDEASRETPGKSSYKKKVKLPKLNTDTENITMVSPEIIIENPVQVDENFDEPETPEPEFVMPNLEEMTFKQLREFCKSTGIKKFSKYTNKTELLKFINSMRIEPIAEPVAEPVAKPQIYSRRDVELARNIFGMDNSEIKEFFTGDNIDESIDDILESSTPMEAEPVSSTENISFLSKLQKASPEEKGKLIEAESVNFLKDFCKQQKYKGFSNCKKKQELKVFILERL